MNMNIIYICIHIDCTYKSIPLAHNSALNNINRSITNNKPRRNGDMCDSHETGPSECVMELWKKLVIGILPHVRNLMSLT